LKGFDCVSKYDEKQKAILENVLSEAKAIRDPSWCHYTMLKQRLESAGIYSVDAVKRLADVLGL